MGPRSANQRSRRTHLLGGCENCRRRHVKCDQVSPKCLTCQAVGLDCEGYSSHVQFVTYGKKKSADQVEKLGTRRYLYTEKSRVLMSSQLAEQVESRTVDTSLAEIDSWSQDASTSRDDGLAVGPFGVIDFSNVTAADPVPAVLEMSNTSPHLIDTPSTLDASNTLPDYLQWSDLFDLDFENWLGQQPDDFGLDHSTTQGPVTPYASLIPSSFSSINATQHTSASFSPSASTDEQELKNEAPALLKHFTDHVIGAIGALPFTSKSPYSMLNVATAVQTLADITYLDRQVKHANNANLYALLACSAYHLGTNPSGPAISNATYWRDLAAKAGRRAKEHLQRSLQVELQGDTKAKYKEQLMALMSIMAYSISAGHQNDVRCYMLDTERLLRLRGLAKRHISRRARLLHHMYTWARIVGESTFVLHDGKASMNVQNMPSITCSQIGHNPRLDDFLRLEQPEEQDAEIEDPKEPEVNLHDIHLRDPRASTDTMYLQIYGLPETWLSLLSQTTRLANVQDLLKHSTGDANANMQRRFEKRAARLEDMVCSFASNTGPPDEVATTLPPSQYMLRALNAALVIFFYRRIRDVNSWILQSHVDHVIGALRHFDLSLTQQNLQGPGTAWPAFIAGCEASPGPRRAALTKWIETAFWKTGLHCFKAAQSMMREVWTRRDQTTATPRSTRSGNSSKGASVTALTWMEVCRERKEWVILC